jgi:hypothetical protein
VRSLRRLAQSPSLTLADVHALGVASIAAKYPPNGDAGIHPGWPNNDSPTAGWIFQYRLSLISSRPEPQKEPLKNHSSVAIPKLGEEIAPAVQRLGTSLLGWAKLVGQIARAYGK